MSSTVVIRKNGGFFCVYGGDAFIFYYLFGYKIVDDKVGFPKSALNRVVNLLQEKTINYELEGELVNYKKRNNYDKFVKSGRKKHSLDFRIKDIMSRLENLSEKDIDKILDYIEEKLWMIDF